MSRDAIALGLIVVAAATLMTVQASVGFVGWDTYPIIAASRIQSFADLRGTFTEWLAAGYFPFGFYRPALNLSMAADYAVWGLDPFGYRLTNVLAFSACGFALFRLARELLGARATVGPFAALLTFIVLPVHRELTIAPFANRGDLLCGVFVVAGLLLQLRRLGDDRPSRRVAPVVCTILAQASKETALVMPALVFVLALVAGPPAAQRVRLVRALRIAFYHVLGVLVIMVPRTIVVGGIAGHVDTRPAALLTRFPGALGQVVLGLVAKSPAHLPGSADVVVLVAVVAASLLLFVVHWRWRRTASAGTDAATRVTATLLVGLAMLGAFAAVYAIVGWVVPWYLFLPGLGLTLVCAGLAEAALLLARGGLVPRLASYGALAAIAGWLAWQLATSPLLRPDSIWVSWTERNDAFLARLRARLDETPDGALLRIAYPVPVLQPYAIRAWLDLVLPERRVRLVGEHEQDLAPYPGVTVVLAGDAAQAP